MHVTTIIAGRRTAWVFALIPILLALALIGGVGEAENETDARYLLPDGADSTAAAWLVDELPDEATEAAIVLWTADEGQLDIGSLGADGEVVPSEDGTAAFMVIPVEAGNADNVGERVEELREQLRDDAPDGVTVQVTGPAGIHADLGKVFDGADLKLLLATMLIVAVLLVVTYRSPVLWVVPLVIVGLADRVAVVAATTGLDAVGLPWDGTTTGILSVLVFGAGTDYALLLISRYRDELRSTESRHEAMAHALRRTSEAVLGSATTVVLAVLTLLLSLTPATRGLGLACAIGIVVAAFFALVALPATLVLFGRWVFWPMVPRHGDRAAVDTDSVFHKVGRLVARRPAGVVAGTLVVLAVLASGLFGMKLGLDEADQLLDRPEAVTAAERLAESFPAGTVEPTQIITSGNGEAVRVAVESTEGVDSARITASGNGVTQLEAVLASEPGSAEARVTIEQLRDELSDLPATHVGGNEAEEIDARDAAERDLLVIVPLILAMVLHRARRTAALGARPGAAGAVRGGDVRRGPRCVLVDLHPGVRLRGGGRDDPAVRVPLPGRARCRLQHLPGDAGTRGGARARLPRGHAAGADRDRRSDHQRRHPAGRGVRRPRRAPPGRARPARHDHLRRRAARHPGRPDPAGPRPRRPARRPVLVAPPGRRGR